MIQGIKDLIDLCLETQKIEFSADKLEYYTILLKENTITAP